MSNQVEVKSWETGKVISSLPLPDHLLSVEVKPHVLSDVVRWQLARRRAGTHKTKTKAEVSGGGKKPFKQKGTGNARQGSIRSPLMPGGGKVFGPIPRSYDYALPKSLRKSALAMVLKMSIEQGHLSVFDKVESVDGKTNPLFKKLKSFGISKALLVTGSHDTMLDRAARNLESFKSLDVQAFNVFDALKYGHIVMSTDQFNSLMEKIGGKHEHH